MKLKTLERHLAFILPQKLVIQTVISFFLRTEKLVFRVLIESIHNFH